ncbi:hypothetical protein [Paenibacillus sp. BJ-4]|uniref:hypothetical protein n=1 Tax=Paenibacillus sp. BJ-4 TaxID=2878097 RepID=UPI001CF03A61|nr:hypothetical protein [Paenibacillus sp. BJ-4]
MEKQAGEIDEKIDAEALHYFIAALSLTLSETLLDKDVGLGTLRIDQSISISIYIE